MLGPGELERDAVRDRPQPVEALEARRARSARPMSCSWRTARGVSPSPQVFSRGKRFFSIDEHPMTARREPVRGRRARRSRADDQHVEIRRCRSTRALTTHMITCSERSEHDTGGFRTTLAHDVPGPASSVVARATRPTRKGAPGRMRDIHVSMLALHVPNVLPYVPWIDFVRHKGFYVNSHSSGCATPAASSGATLLFVIGLAASALRDDEEAEAGRARDVGADDARRDVRVVHDGARLRHDPARVADVRQLVPQLQHRDLPACTRTGSSTFDITRVGGRRHRRDASSTSSCSP